MSARAISLAVVIAVSLGTPLAGADLVIPATHSDGSPQPGASLEDVRLSVELSVSGSVATMTFANVSVSSGASAVFKEIVLDTCDNDTAAAVLWNGAVVTDTAGVGFDLVPSNGLPGYQAVTGGEIPLAEFQSDPPPPKEGLGVGELLVAQFATCLPDGADLDDYLAFFGDGDDTAEYSIGFHAISVDTVGGGSVSGIYAPEPATLLLLAPCAAGLLRRRRRH